MKPFFRFFLGAALPFLASVATQAAPVMIPSGVTATAASAAPGEAITLSVSATNAGTATPADDMVAGGTVTGTVVFTHRVTGATISTDSVTFSTKAVIAGAGGEGTFTRIFTVPTITSQAGSYDASVTLTGASAGGTASGSFSATKVLTVTGTPDLAITGLTYPAGTAYRGGDVIPMTLSYTNRTRSIGLNNVPYVSSTNGNAASFRIEVILSSNPTFGDADDFLLTAHQVTASSGFPLNANNTNTTIGWNQVLPGNFAGSYYVMAKIDTLAGVTETIENDLTDNGNNIYSTPDTNAARISLLPTNFPTVNWASTAGNGYSDNPTVTSDGRYTAYVSDSTTLVTGDTNSVRDVFIYDNQTATARRLSVAQQGAQSNGASNHPAISAVSTNGTYVAFSSDATNLALDDTNGFSDIYIVNVFTGVITRVSVSTAGVQSNGSNFKPAISVTGRYVAWESTATNLIVAGTSVGVTHVYLRDRDVANSGTYDTAGNVSTVLISQATGAATPGNGHSLQATVSADGQFVAFASDATNLGGTVGGGFRNIYLRDVTNSTTTLASFGTTAAASNGSSRAPSLNRNTGVTTGISADGRHVAFGSEASNLITAGTDTNAVSDIFVYDRVARAITRVSVSSAGAQATDPSATSAQQLGSINPSISATGRYVAFASLADNLTAGDSNGQATTTDANGAMDVFVMDRDVSNSGTFDTAANLATTMVSKNRFGYQTLTLLGTPSTAGSDIYPVISADGRWVAFPSDAENTAGLIHGATNRTSPDLNTFRDVFLHDRRINALPTATTPPAVAVTSPVTATTYPVNSAITLIGSASAPLGTIASVQFFVNGTSLGIDTSFPYNATWTPTATGSFSLSALVTDSFSNQASSANVNITIAAVSPTAPTVSITSPATGAALFANAPTAVSAAASDVDGTIASVQFFANGVSIGTDTTFPYSVQFTPVATGNYTLTAVATDNGGNQTTTTGAGNSTVSVTNLTAPTISITSPTPVSINAITTITATAASGGSIASVQFLANGTTLGTQTTAPFAFSWTPTAAGSYSLTAVATDNLGSQTTSATITVFVSSGASPVFSPLTPIVPATIFVNTAQTITAAVADADGTVVSVRFSVNGTILGTAIAFPYSVTWTPKTAGAYTVLAVATDNLGNQTTSSAASVMVSSGAAPSVALTSPSNGSIVRVGSGAMLAATAADPDGTIASVQFFANGLSIGTDTTPPYSVQWTPTAEGSYHLTAVALDNSGAVTTSATLMTLAMGASSGGSDSVYTGTYAGGGELGRFAAISIRGKTAVFIGFSTTTPNRVYFYDSLPLDLGGGFFRPDSLGRGIISGSVNDTGASGTLDAGRVTFIGPVTFPMASGSVAAGLYSGNLSGRPTSLVDAIVGSDGAIFVYITDGGSFRDAGAGALSSTGAFAITTSSGHRFIGRADPVTGFLGGTLTGGPGGTFTAALASGVSFSDGFLRNLSTRGPVGTGNDVLVAGFAVSGSQPKRVLIRAIGPTLAVFGVTGALAHARLELFSGSTLIGSNDSWGGAANVVAASAQVGAFALPATSLDSAIIATLPPGPYTALVSGVGGRSGLALVELYDLDTQQAFSTQKLTNVATRAMLTTAQNEIIAGFMVSGSIAKKVLIRAVGPTLGGAPFNLPNTLANPMLSLLRSDGVVIRENDNWEIGNDAALINEASVKVGAFALTAGARDSAILINLPPGIYYAQISGAAPGTGTVLVEVYEVP